MKEIRNMTEFKEEFKLVKQEAGDALRRIHDRGMGLIPEDENDDVGYYIHRHEAFPHTSIGWGEIVVSKELLSEFLDWISVNRWKSASEWDCSPATGAKRKLR